MGSLHAAPEESDDLGSGAAAAGAEGGIGGAVGHALGHRPQHCVRIIVAGLHIGKGDVYKRQA